MEAVMLLQLLLYVLMLFLAYLGLLVLRLLNKVNKYKLLIRTAIVLLSTLLVWASFSIFRR